MSNLIALTLHQPEETIACDVSALLVPFPDGPVENPISDYFINTSHLVVKIIDTDYADDSEILGLLVLGVISSAEFYFRAVLSELARACPLCVLHTESLAVASGSVSFYAGSGYGPIMAAFEHKSLADSKKIRAEIANIVNLKCTDSSSVKKALDDFDSLCELRHCLVHSRGFAGLKAMQSLSGERSLHKILVTQQNALDLIKLSHNAVRAVNHYLSVEVLNRWIEKDVICGVWSKDKKLFNMYWKLFSKRSEDAYDGSARKAYGDVRKVVLARQQGIANK